MAVGENPPEKAPGDEWGTLSSSAVAGCGGEHSQTGGESQGALPVLAPQSSAGNGRSQG